MHLLQDSKLYLHLQAQALGNKAISTPPHVLFVDTLSEQKTV